MKIMHVAGARPNFMKIAPVIAAMSHYSAAFIQVLVHTGQHYDEQMSRVFFTELGIPTPDEYLGVGSGTHTEQTARIMLALEPVLLKHQPDWVVVVGDVNSTLASALTSVRLGVRLAHVEAGLRSGDRSMPEEINRLLTDQLADLLFTPSPDGDANLLREGILAQKIHLVGNVMIDTLVRLLPQARDRSILADLQLQPREYVLVTLHRPSNVDQPLPLAEILAALSRLGQQRPVIFPLHPRTRQRISQFGLSAPTVRFLEPLGYLDFLALTDAAGLVITDSGGIQEETTYLGVPCLTLRPTTERPVTIEIGTNRLVASRCADILDAVARVQWGMRGFGRIPDLWDGHAAERIARVFLNL